MVAESRIDEPTLVFSTNPEIFFVRGKIVATQASYNMPYCKFNVHEVLNFYCSTCGEVWGQRITPHAKHSRHRYLSSPCRAHGGNELMLNPFELRRTDILGSDVLCLLFLEKTQEVEENED